MEVKEKADRWLRYTGHYLDRVREEYGEKTMVFDVGISPEVFSEIQRRLRREAGGEDGDDAG